MRDSNASGVRDAAGRLWRLLLLSGVLIGLGTSAAVAAVPSGKPPIMFRSATTVTADGLPTMQIDGVVWSQVIIEDKVFAAGTFTTARPAGAAPGTSTVKRQNIAMYSMKSGLLQSFAPAINGTVDAMAASKDGKTLYVVGQFTMVGSESRPRFAAFDVATGKLKSTQLSFNSRVRAVTVVKNTVYVGGWFTAVGSSPRGRAAAFDATTGKLTSWNPRSDGPVNALVATPDQGSIVLGGSFAQLGSTKARGLGRVSPTAASVLSWKINTVVDYEGPNAAVYSLSADSTTVYGSGFAYHGGNFEGVFAANPSDGSVKWLQDCHGDTYSVAPIGATLYAVGHAHYCSNIGGFPDTNPRNRHQRALAMTTDVRGTVGTNGQPGNNYGNFAGNPAPALRNWFPDLKAGTFTGTTQAAWNVVGNSTYIALGGEFTDVNGVPQQGLVRFAVPTVAPVAQGPTLDGPETAPTLTQDPDGSVQLEWLTNVDRDDAKLNYEVLRDTVVLDATKKTAYFWDRKVRRFTDTTAVPGATYQYRIRVTDPDGNQVLSPPSTLTVAPKGSAEQRASQESASQQSASKESASQESASKDSALQESASKDSASTAKTVESEPGQSDPESSESSDPLTQPAPSEGK